MTAPTPGPKVRIEYCTLCHWLLRAAWFAQELLSTFPQDLSEVTLVPVAGGTFRITLDDEVIWDRKEEHGFPDIATLKQIVRDRVEPDRDLGHIDRSHPRHAH